MENELAIQDEETTVTEEEIVKITETVEVEVEKEETVQKKLSDIEQAKQSLEEKVNELLHLAIIDDDDAPGTLERIERSNSVLAKMIANQGETAEKIAEDEKNVLGVIESTGKADQMLETLEKIEESKMILLDIVQKNVWKALGQNIKKFALNWHFNEKIDCH